MMTFPQMFRLANEHPAYYEQGLILDFTEGIAEAMQKRGMSKLQLARKIKCHPSFITKVMQGSNFSISTMVKIAMALDCELKLTVTQK